MKGRMPADIRNVAIVGHGGAGKTTLIDNLLYAAGAVNRAGSVDDGTSLSDYDPEEKDRQFSVDTTIFHFQWKDRAFNLIDTPGYLEFAGAASAAIPVVETALIAINASDGIQLNTRQMWQRAERAGVSRAVVITHLDNENLRYRELLDDIQDNFGRQCVPFFLPVGLGQDCSGVVDLLKASEPPEGVVGDFESLKEELTEGIIECDDELMEQYLEGEEVGADRIRSTFRRAMMSGDIVPILCCAPLKGIGLKELLDFTAECLPSPEDALPAKATDENDEEVELSADPEGPFCARVFKTTMDVHVGKLAYFRIYSGSLGEDPTVRLPRTGKDVRLGHLYTVFGRKQQEVQSGTAGDILCVSKVEELELNDTLCGPDRTLVLEPMEFPRPMMSLAVEPHSRDDEEKISTGLQKIAEGDPSFEIRRDQRSAELVITGMSNLHLEVNLSRLKRRYDVDADTREPTIPYQETITKGAQGHYRHKKQTGGRGQYGEVYLRIDPLERGEGLEFVDEIKGGVIPTQYVPAVEKGIRQLMESGPLANSPIVDVRVTVYDGSYHSVDSSEAAFKIAGSRAFREAFENAKPVLLEPIVQMEVSVPSEYMGDVTANLTGHRGRIQGMDHGEHMQVIRAEIPMAEVSRYSTELKSITGGEGTFALEFSHYEQVPQHLQQQIIARRRAEQED